MEKLGGLPGFGLVTAATGLTWGCSSLLVQVVALDAGTEPKGSRIQLPL